MLYKKGKKVKRNYDYLVTPASNEHLLKKKNRTQKVSTKFKKK